VGGIFATHPFLKLGLGPNQTNFGAISGQEESPNTMLGFQESGVRVGLGRGMDTMQTFSHIHRWSRMRGPCI